MNIRSVNPKIAALVGLVILAGLLLMGLHAGELPLINPSRVSYQAQFSDAGGLQASDAVQIAGVVVGQVKDVSIQGSAVVVDFNVDTGISLGDESTATVKIGSLLGSKYLEIEPSGPGRLASDSMIPLSRTTPAYDVATAFGDLTTVVKQLDTTSIAKALNVLSGSFSTAPADVRAAVQGLSALSHTIASRDVAFRALMAHASSATAVLDQRRQDVVQILNAADLVLQALQQRKAVVDQLLRNTVSLTTQLDGLVSENSSSLAPALRQLATVTQMLDQHQGDIAATIANLNNYIETFNNVVGSGPWFDVVIPRLPNSIAVAKR